MSVPTCWQFLVKQQQRRTHEGDLPGRTLDDVTVAPIPYRHAKEFILNYEWLHSMGAAVFCYGMHIDGHLACVACYGPPSSPKSYSRMVGPDISRMLLQLCRGASTFWAPKWAPSKLIARSLKLLTAQTDARAVVAYADPQAGEVGTIYQACNGFYLGPTDAGGAKMYVVNGQMYHPRTVYRRFGSRAKDHLLTIDPNFTTIPIPPKHRYIFPLGSRADKNEMLNRIAPLVQPYPKRNTK